MSSPPSRVPKMKTHSARNQSKSRNYPLLTASVLAVAAFLVGSLPQVATAQSFDNVQIFVTPSAQLPYSYTYTAYNTTGSLVATYQAQLPAAAFEVPPGDYLFTVSAVYQNYVACLDCPIVAGGQTQPGGSQAMPPYKYQQPASEYGYLLAHVDGPKTYTISTMNVTTFPTTTIGVKASFVNGTAAPGAYVSASVVGQWYYWWAATSNGSNWAQTGPDGTATLVVPKAPVIVTGWLWVPVNLPTNQTTVVKNIGGQDVNVTVYWQPTYVGLSASTLVIPPSTSANLTLRYQEPTYWAMPGGIQYAGMGQSGSGQATVASQPTGVPSQMLQASGSGSNQQQFFVPQQIPQLSVNGEASATPNFWSGLLIPLTVGATAGATAVALTWLALSRRKSAPVPTA